MTDILIIEDNTELGEVFCEIFQKNQIDAIHASSGQAGVDLLKEHLSRNQAPMICLLDVVLPELSGVDLMRKLRTIVPEIRFMLMTGYHDIPQIKAMEKESIVEIFYKPFRAAELIGKVNFILSNTKRIPVQ